MSLTIVSHFYNEEYLLPWWCKHHRKVCDHAIMIDYGSTDNSVNIIKSLCPDWKIVKTKNKHFDVADIDNEVEIYESHIKGWKITLNTTEFLYGNVKQLDYPRNQEPSQKFIGNYMFLYQDSNFRFDPEKFLHEQCRFGYRDTHDRTNMLGFLYRTSRSIHNIEIDYPILGRHFPDPPSFKDLWIFYYGLASISREMLDRKMQIKTKISEKEKNMLGDWHPNNIEEEKWINYIEVHQKNLGRDVSFDVDFISKFNYP